MEASMNEGSHTNLPQIIPEKDQNNNFALNSHEKSEIFSHPTLDYIRRYLLEEDIDGEISECQEAALKDMEKPFHDILAEKYRPSDNQLLSNQSKENPNFTCCISKDQVGTNFNESLKEPSSIENLLTIQFHRGVEEGMKFLPNLNQLSIDLQVSKLTVDPMKKCDDNFRLGEKKENGLLHNYKGKTSSNNADLDLLEGRNCKIPMVTCEETIRDAIFDKVLLNCEDNYEREETSSLDKSTDPEANCRNKDKNKEEHFNLRALLIACAEAIFINDIKMASELTKKIRKHASPIGDGIQRLACVFALGLEARLAGTGSAILRQFATRRLKSNDTLKIYDMTASTSPILRVAIHFVNKSILMLATGATSKIHIVDFGIGFGFQWPSLIQDLAKMKDGPSSLRITGVDLPQPGFHPDERIKLTGKRLEDYARDFGVPFEYHGIASQWDSISIEDLNIRDDEVLVVNSMYTVVRLRDEILLGMNKSRNQLLNLIRAIQPKVFTHGVIKLAFSPYFLPRFRMNLLQYLRLYDMFDTFVPPNSKPRQLEEFALFGPHIFNQIACEGTDLDTIPETYNQCHKRNLETSFEQLPVDPNVLEECCKIVRNGYNKGLFAGEDCNWFLQGWKGNIFYAASLWKPRLE
ncbi:GRAS transcription factor [Rhynchospora pubera]|uniref:GRAS transcription factor n=1 Tax=Rhynchospora pubera TaxID=906938 RepID=A0AAV8F135_9POAL|nr:GRAS transcription factor [Rhynchospora pubera]